MSASKKKKNKREKFFLPPPPTADSWGEAFFDPSDRYTVTTPTHVTCINKRYNLF